MLTCCCVGVSDKSAAALVKHCRWGRQAVGVVSYSRWESVYAVNKTETSSRERQVLLYRLVFIALRASTAASATYFFQSMATSQYRDLIAILSLLYWCEFGLSSILLVISSIALLMQPRLLFTWFPSLLLTLVAVVALSTLIALNQGIGRRRQQS